MPGHDLGYKALFSSPRMVEDLLVGFLPESWVSKVELSSLGKISGSYTGDILVERNDDVVAPYAWDRGCRAEQHS